MSKEVFDLGKIRKMTPYIEKAMFREGILKPGSFSYNYDLRCYEPSDDLKPFVEHYFISRRRHVYDTDYVGHDVLSQPVVTLFIKPEGAYFEGPTTGRRTLRAKDSPIYVGAQFKPGGFYAFYKKPINQLAEKNIKAAAVLPGLTEKVAEDILSQDNQQILTSIESLLRMQKPEKDFHLELINKIINIIENDSNMTTVAKVASHFGISDRSVQHLFQTYVGVGAKWAIMRVRFLEVIKYAREQEKPDWLHIAAEYGYSDQSHFINDFKKMTGESPSQYINSGVDKSL
jgi:AraC-like DNA-binding protein